jgi:hypothetical protein
MQTSRSGLSESGVLIDLVAVRIWPHQQITNNRGSPFSYGQNLMQTV